MGRSKGEARRQSRDCSRGRSRKREQSKDRSRESSCEQVRDRSRDRSTEYLRDQSRDRSRDRRQGRSRDRGDSSSRDHRRNYSRNRSLDRERDRSRERARDQGRRRSDDRARNYSRTHSRDRSRNRRRSENTSSSEDLRATVKQLKRELRNMQSRSTVNDEFAVPKFDPSRDNADIEQWVRQVDRLAWRYMWSDDNIIINISRNLKGYARRVFDEEQKRDHTWKSLKTILVQRFKRPLPFGRLLHEASEYSAHPGQKLGDYCFEKLAKLRA